MIEGDKRLKPKLPPIPRDLAEKVKKLYGMDYPILEDQEENEPGVLEIDTDTSLDTFDDDEKIKKFYEDKEG